MADLADRFDRETVGMSDADRAQVAARLGGEAVRRATIARCPTPGALAQYCDPSMVPTPAFELIDRALVWAYRTPGARLMISCPPQIGKSVRAVTWFPLWALQRNSDLRITAASHSLELIAGHNRATRNYILTCGTDARDSLTGEPLTDKLGFTVADDKAAAAHWTIKGRKGGMYVAGVGGTMVGKPSDLFIIDDLYASLDDASSDAYRRMVRGWWTGTALTRLAPTASVVMIGTRWAPNDLMGDLLAEDVERVRRGQPPLWRVINIPAIATPGVPDTLQRPTEGPNRYLITARGHTPAQWDERKAEVGSRVWAAEYLGDPKPDGSTVFQQAWFTRTRTYLEPQWAARIVSIDPADTGKGDEAGILGLGADATGRQYVTHDESGLMQSDAWSRRGVLLALRTAARAIVYEAYVVKDTYRKTIQTAWTRIREQALIIGHTGGDLEQAAALLTSAASASATLDPDQLAAELREIADLMDSVEAPDPDVFTAPRIPITVIPHRGKNGADKRMRAATAAQYAETGKLVMLGEHPTLEGQAVSWMVTDSASPDRMDALSNGVVELARLTGAQQSSGIAPGAAVAAGTLPDPAAGTRQLADRRVLLPGYAAAGRVGVGRPRRR